MTTIEHANALYHTLRQLKGRDFDENDYMWKIGAGNIFECVNYTNWERENEALTLFGIGCEIDYNNPHEIKLFEDITNKVSIPYAEFQELEERNDQGTY